MCDEMEENQFAQLNSEQIQDLNKLEEKLGVTLLAFASTASINENSEISSDFPRESTSS